MRGQGSGAPRRRWEAALAVCAGLVGPAASPAAGARGSAPAGEAFVDYLYVHASEGGSSGGHAAIRFGDETFHFQHDDGLLRARREDSQRFQYAYRTLQNRTIELTRVRVSLETRTLLRDTFARRQLVQEAQLGLLAALRLDVRLLEAWLAEEAGAATAADAPGFELDGLGFFFDAASAGALLEGAEAETAGAQAPLLLRRLQERILARHGRDHLERRRQDILASLAESRAEPVDVWAIALDPDRLPAPRSGFARRYANDLAALFALEVLERPRALRAQACVAASGADALALASSELDRLRSGAEALLDQLAALAASRRPDWGGALLLGMARLAALEASLRESRLVLLESLPADAETIRVTEHRRALLPDLLDEAHGDLASARRIFFSTRGFREAEWSALEAGASRSLELRRARAGAPRIRVHPGALLPEGQARVTGLPRPRADGVPLARRLEQAREAERRYREALRDRYGYHLVLHNCVSEIFRTLEAALAGPAVPGTSASALRSLARRESERRLGGWIDPVGSFNFVPFVSSQHVARHYDVSERRRLSSWRHSQLARMLEQESRLRVALRESNPWSATTHQPAEGEGFFLFFTDTQVLPRPLLGAANLTAGLVRSAFGVLELPIDRGRGLRAGLEGVLWSLPELVFQSVRKGSNEYVRPEDRAPAG